MELTKTQCPICKVSLNQTNLKKHLKKVHSGNKSPLPIQADSTVSYQRTMYRCKQCKKLFGLPAAAEHLRKAHDFVPRSTENCHRFYFDEVTKQVTRSSIRKKRTMATGAIRASTESIKQVLAERATSRKAMRKQGLSIQEIANSFFHCGICDAKVRNKNAKRHFKNAHNWDIAKKKEYENGHNSASNNRASGIREESISPNEFFNRTQVVSGGAYGLGKNSRH